jgi:hypothetical protein
MCGFQKSILSTIRLRNLVYELLAILLLSKHILGLAVHSYVVWNIKWNMLTNDVSMTHLHAICAGNKFPGALRKRWEFKWLLLTMNVVVFVIINPTLCVTGQHSLRNGDLQKWCQTWIKWLYISYQLDALIIIYS